jgi:hypothetical protein
VFYCNVSSMLSLSAMRKAITSLPCPNFPAAIRRRGHWTTSPNAFAKWLNYASTLRTPPNTISNSSASSASPSRPESKSPGHRPRITGRAHEVQLRDDSQLGVFALRRSVQFAAFRGTAPSPVRGHLSSLPAAGRGRPTRSRGTAPLEPLTARLPASVIGLFAFRATAASRPHRRRTMAGG